MIPSFGKAQRNEAQVSLLAGNTAPGDSFPLCIFPGFDFYCFFFILDRCINTSSWTTNLHLLLLPH